jgi:hypothetical protein
MNINHRPILDVKFCEEAYSKKDGVPIKYVCTTALDGGVNAGDVFYRDTPHPKFGNRYFQLFVVNNNLFIRGADVVEDLTFDMLYGEGYWHYSQHRHDYVPVDFWAIDGGRAYTRIVGEDYVMETFKVKDGEFVCVQ